MLQLLYYMAFIMSLHHPPLSHLQRKTVMGNNTRFILKAEWGKVELRDVQRRKRIEITIWMASEEPENSYTQKMFGHLEINFLGQVSYNIAYTQNLKKMIQTHLVTKQEQTHRLIREQTSRYQEQ